MASEAPTDHQELSASQTSAAGGGSGSPAETLTPLEQEVLDEYARLLGNLNNMSNLLAELSANPSADILDSLRGLERKTSLVFTLLKASVYSIVLNQQFEQPGDDDGPDGMDGGDAGSEGGGLGGMGMSTGTGMGMGMGLGGYGASRPSGY